MKNRMKNWGRSGRSLVVTGAQWMKRMPLAFVLLIVVGILGVVLMQRVVEIHTSVGVWSSEAILRNEMQYPKVNDGIRKSTVSGAEFWEQYKREEAAQRVAEEKAVAGVDIDSPHFLWPEILKHNDMVRVEIDSAADIPAEYRNCDVYKSKQVEENWRKWLHLNRSGLQRPAEPVFKVIVLTFNRSSSLQRLLTSLEEAVYNGSNVDLDIFIDKPKDGTPLDEETLRVGVESTWSHGEKTVLARKVHAGLVAQWIDTWQPRAGMNDHVMLLEDDLEVSPWYFIWWRNAQRRYGHRPDIAGCTLQRGTLRARQTTLKTPLNVSETYETFLYPLVGSWGYAPRRESWMQFREWYHKNGTNPSFHPYVEGLKPTEWYKSQEAKGTMWTMHYIWFCDKNKLFVVYANLKNKWTLCSNWREAGLHYSNSNPKPDFVPLPRNESLPALSEHPIMLDWAGVIHNAKPQPPGRVNDRKHPATVHRPTNTTSVEEIRLQSNKTKNQGNNKTHVSPEK